MLGATHEAKDLEIPEQGHPHRQPDHGRGLLARGCAVKTEEVSSIRFEEGVPVALNGKTYSDRSN
jgi:argininosuccinate synthase